MCGGADIASLLLSLSLSSVFVFIPRCFPAATVSLHLSQTLKGELVDQLRAFGRFTPPTVAVVSERESLLGKNECGQHFHSCEHCADGPTEWCGRSDGRETTTAKAKAQQQQQIVIFLGRGSPTRKDDERNATRTETQIGERKSGGRQFTEDGKDGAERWKDVEVGWAFVGSVI